MVGVGVFVDVDVVVAVFAHSECAGLGVHGGLVPVGGEAGGLFVVVFLYLWSAATVNAVVEVSFGVLHGGGAFVEVVSALVALVGGPDFDGDHGHGWVTGLRGCR